jgi:glycerol kinase
MGLPDRSAAGTGRGMEVFAVTGGMAKNRGLVERLEKVLGVRALKTDQDPQIAGAAGAAGAALFAQALAEKARRKEVPSCHVQQKKRRLSWPGAGKSSS